MGKSFDTDNSYSESESTKSLETIDSVSLDSMFSDTESIIYTIMLIMS